MTASNGQYFLHVHLLVTGEAEEEHLPKLFSRLESTGICRVVVERRIRQRSPRTGKRRLQMVGRPGVRIPSRAENEISIPVRLLLRDHPDRFLVLIDDLEHDRRDDVEAIFGHYRESLDLLLDAEEKSRAAVHFLVNMLEAYFFADPAAVERALGLHLGSPDGDVEEIRHPKKLLKRHFPAYRERDHGGRVLEHLDLHRVLADPAFCSWLRSCVAWLVRAFRQQLDMSLHPTLAETATACHVEEGRCQGLTLEQGWA